MSNEGTMAMPPDARDRLQPARVEEVGDHDAEARSQPEGLKAPQGLSKVRPIIGGQSSQDFRESMEAVTAGAGSNPQSEVRREGEQADAVVLIQGDGCQGEGRAQAGAAPRGGLFEQAA